MSAAGEETNEFRTSRDNPPLMRRIGSLSPSVWLDLWEHGQGLTSAQRALIWLQAARVNEHDDPALWPIGERDRQILLLRESSFGVAMAGTVSCPRCAEQLEVPLTTHDILPRGGSPAGDIVTEFDDGIDRLSASFRLPLTGDLTALRASTPETARDELLAACFLSGDRGETPITFDDVPEQMRVAVEAEMAALDPDATIDLRLTCPACTHAWEQAFDAPSFFAAELDAWARRTLNDVHTLAQAYGWTEADILGLSATRRQLYLGLVAP